jgi:hypothetical protein
MFFTCQIVFYGLLLHHARKRYRETSVWAVELFGGKAYKFTSPANRGVADRIVCWPNGTTWFVELKKEGGKLSALQQRFAAEMRTLRQNYTVLWSKEDVDQWIARPCGA